MTPANPMQQRWYAYSQRFYAQSRQRRSVWLAITLLVALVVWFSNGLAPALEQRAALQQQLNQALANEQRIQQNQRELRELLKVDPNAALKAQQQQLTRRAERIQEQLAADLRYLSPAQQQQLVQGLLTDVDQLVVERAQALELEPLDDLPIARQPIQLTLTGDYFAVRDYFARISQLPQSFYWSRLDYRVTSYPKAEVNLQLHTLSAVPADQREGDK